MWGPFPLWTLDSRVLHTPQSKIFSAGFPCQICDTEEMFAFPQIPILFMFV